MLAAMMSYLILSETALAQYLASLLVICCQDEGSC